VALYQIRFRALPLQFSEGIRGLMQYAYQHWERLWHFAATDFLKSSAASLHGFAYKL
jgi:hypothetical protein